MVLEIICLYYHIEYIILCFLTCKQEIREVYFRGRERERARVQGPLDVLKDPLCYLLTLFMAQSNGPKLSHVSQTYNYKKI